MNTLILPNQILSDLNKAKVCLIHDINKLSKLIDSEPITPDDFDLLYDLDIDELQYLVFAGENAVRNMQTLKRLSQAVFRIQQRAQGGRTNDEEGD